MLEHTVTNSLQVMPNLFTILDVRDRIQQAQSVTVLTGAGISADSGVPTFRGPEGLWKDFRPEELASPDAFARDPKLVWEWYNWRRELLATKRPNPAHEALVQLETQLPDFWVITQNVDGLHATAGTQHLSEIHGNIWKVRCTQCHKVTVNHDVPLPFPPSCADCGELLRPHIVWFGESLAPEDLEHSYAALKRCDILLIIGTSGCRLSSSLVCPGGQRPWGLGRRIELGSHTQLINRRCVFSGTSERVSSTSAQESTSSSFS